ncbi:MAG: permease [Deltaproteobacteria bacterium]|nr:permease [Deltaproteobacteria bacterium]MBW2152278.1 permease [Deltaproteobacteria bacterium]
MKKILKDALKYVLVAAAVWGIIGMVSPAKCMLVGEVAYGAFTKAIDIIIAVFLMIGLIQVWVSPQKLSNLLGKEAGWKALAFASTVPLFIGSSLFTIFPLLKTLRDKGASIAAVTAFIAAWGGKAPLLPLEIEFLGWKFAVLRICLIVPFAVCIGLLSQWILEKWGYRHPD